MAEIAIEYLEGQDYQVHISQGGTTTSHRVQVSSATLEELGLSDGTEAVRASFEFLLEREPNTSILREFALDDISTYFPEYVEHLRGRQSR
jgi:hypothetical protein